MVSFGMLMVLGQLSCPSTNSCSSPSYAVHMSNDAGTVLSVAGYSATKPAMVVLSTQNTGVSVTASGSGNAVQGLSSVNFASGVYGENSTAGGIGVAGRNTSGCSASCGGSAVFADIPIGAATYGINQVGNTGTNRFQSPITKPAGSFEIDHPLDPENKYLFHSFVESDEMKNVYDGIVTLDSVGQATVKLPDWFSAINKDFRYQLTPIGFPAQVYILAELRGNSFTIAGGKGGQRISWQITGVRNDAWARRHRMQVEVPKAEADRGRYLDPVGFGASAHSSPPSIATNPFRGVDK